MSPCVYEFHFTHHPLFWSPGGEGGGRGGGGVGGGGAITSPSFLVCQHSFSVSMFGRKTQSLTDDDLAHELSRKTVVAISTIILESNPIFSGAVRMSLVSSSFHSQKSEIRCEK